MVREPIAEGFYPGNAKILDLMLDKLFKDTKKTVKRDVIGLIAPHAGYLYSGKTAAKVYAQISKKYDSIIILGPDHTGMAETVSVSTEDWKTPLGEVKIDKELAEKIISGSDIIIEDEDAHMYEHSIEVQLPFLQYLLKDFRFVPIIIPHNNMDLEKLKKIADTINDAIEGKNILVIASSDLTHFGKGYSFVPVEKDELEWMEKTDMAIMEKAAELDEIQTLNKAKDTTACGSYPIAILILIMKNKVDSGEIIDYSTSYEISKNKDIIVGYGGIVF
ncbi:MAG: AmmeMemoRadiSam system protein B [Candidatus Aenigmarchaeota archaeon]|nr:AmmeMemoRadiSam system protein B [Candidatus Aenigmarchaeota archaeon]